jgi:hypothetical protein
MTELSIKPLHRLTPQLSASTVGFLSLLVFTLIFVSVLVGQVVNRTYLLGDPDTYWHITVGQEIWETGSFPQRDQFSWTFEGQRWIAKEWLSQLVLFAAYHFGSWHGVVLISAAALGFAYALLFAVLARQMRITVTVGVVMLACFLGLAHFLARPHVFSFPLLVLWAAGLVRAVEEQRAPNWLLLPVMTLWANMHAGFTLGLAIAGVLAAEAVFTSERAMRIGVALRWMTFLAAAFLAGCVTPYGYEPLLMTFKLYGGQPLQYISEWAPLNAKHDGFVELPLMGLLFLSLYFGVKIRFWRLILIIGLVHLIFLHVRMVPLFGFLTPILIASSLVYQFRFLRLESQMERDPGLFRAAERFSSRLAYGTVGCFIALAAAVFATESISPNKEHAPANAVDYLQRANLTEHIYNDFGFGGYLIFRGVKTFIDGRIDQLFQAGFLERSWRASSQGTLAELLTDYGIKVALVKPKSNDMHQIEQIPGWSKAYSDDTAIVFIRKPNVGWMPDESH